MRLEHERGVGVRLEQRMVKLKIRTWDEEGWRLEHGMMKVGG
jgi:hypothetical protein